MIFVDSSAWYALLVEQDVHHLEARKFFAEVGGAATGPP